MTCHKAIYGGTECGKSTLARALANAALLDGIIPVVYDPTLNEDWCTEFVTCDMEEFYDLIEEVYESGRPIFGIIDEADTVLGVGDKENHWVATRGRHFNMEMCFITQRPQMIAPTVRNQTKEQYVFELAHNDAKFIADAHNAPDLIAAPTLMQGEFLYCRMQDKKKKVDKLRIF